MSDGTRQKLTLPPWHTPYLEKHKIMELFYELAREAVIQQPVDHLMFTKQLLYRAAKNISIPRVLILSSPKVNCMEVAKQMAQQTGQTIISEDIILSHMNVKSRAQVRPGALAMCLAYLLHTEDSQNRGWILVDCIRTAREAKKVLHTGIIPTHVLHLIPPFCPSLNELLYCDVPESWPEYRREIMRIRDVYKNKLVEIFLRQRFIHEVVRECIDVIGILKSIGCPQSVRLLLLGPRGSGRNTQARAISQKLNLIHIDFQYILCQAYNSDNELARTLRECKDEICYHSDLLAQVVNQKVLEDECLHNGWILTGFPYTVTDFRYLDTLDTPPNRVIFLECDLNVCRERLINRRVNVYTGSITDIVQKPENILFKRMKVHPKDKIDLVDAELNYYCEQYGSLRNYCGETAQVVNADQPERWVTECILAFISRGALAAPPRNPCEDERKSESDVDSTASSSFVQDVHIPGIFVTKI